MPNHNQVQTGLQPPGLPDGETLSCAMRPFPTGSPGAPGRRPFRLVIVSLTLALLVAVACSDGGPTAGSSGRSASGGSATTSGVPASGSAPSIPAGSGSGGPGASDQPTARPTAPPLDHLLAEYLSGRQGDVSVAVYDTVGRRWFGYRQRSEHQMASVVKVTILATLLRQQQEGQITLSAGDRELMRRMIEVSDNDAATALWNRAGGDDGIAAFAKLAGMWETEPQAAWGLTTTTAPDQVILLRLLALPNPILDEGSRASALALLDNVDPSQRWGIDAGIPPGVTVAIKDGWLGIPGEGWIVNSIGYVNGAGRRYVIAVLSDHGPGYDYGIATIEHASQLVWTALQPPS